MQTFLPFESYTESAKALDNKRLNKQIVECLQIFRALTRKEYGWKNHPAVKMWKGHEMSLVVYATEMHEEYQRRFDKFHQSYRNLYKDMIDWQLSFRLDEESLQPMVDSIEYPPWLGNEDFHRSHRSNLKRKDPDYYQFDEPDDLPYVWPTQTIY